MEKRSRITFMLLRTKFGKNRLVYNALKKHPEITEIYEVFGRYGLIARVETKDLDEMNRFIQNKIWLTEGISDAETLITNNLLDYDDELVDDEDITEESDVDETPEDDDGQFVDV